MSRLLGSGVAIIVAATILAGAAARPQASAPAPPRQSFNDVAMKGLLWHDRRFVDVTSFNRWLRRHGATYRVWALRHPTLSLGLWQHALCRPSCSAALAAQRLRSWNPHVRCRPLLTTIARLVGRRASPLGGATEPGGALQPHLTGAAKHALSPPCLLGDSAPTFVELDGVQISQDFPPPADGDQVFNVTDTTRKDLPEPMRTMHVEIDGEWRAAGIAPPVVLPPVGARVDLEGFVYWDAEHTDEAWHSFSGWELHPLASWRLTQGG